MNDLQAMIDRYLDDETFKAYSEALNRKNNESAAKARALAKKRSTPPALVPKPVAETQPPSQATAPLPPIHQPKPAPAQSTVPF
jgi:hypothetical protein